MSHQISRLVSLALGGDGGKDGEGSEDAGTYAGVEVVAEIVS